MSEQKDFQVIKFEATNLPTPYESVEKTNDKPVWYGTDNLYPNFLLKLYNESPIHASIINSKANYILGDGIKVGNEIVKVKVNDADTINEFLGKLVKDYLIFNFFCVEVIYNRLNQPIEYHFIPAHKVRTNKDKTKFWYYEDVSNTKKSIVYDRWKPNSQDSNSKIFFFDGYFPTASNTYPTPEYNGSLKSILTDIEIKDFNLNNIKNHFSVATLINFFNGNPLEDNRHKILKSLKETYTGSKGLKLMVGFNHPTDNPPTVQNISANDWDKAYEQVGKRVEDDIMIGHGVVSPMLFGIKTEGQLGGATELEIAYEIFKNNYINVKRAELQGALNMMFFGSEIIKGSVEFADKQLFSTRLPDTLKEKIYTLNELRKEAGLPSIPNGDRLLSETAQPTPAKFSKAFHLTEEDYEKIKDMGIVSEEFEFIDEGEFVNSKEDFSRIELQFDTQSDIADYIINNDIDGMDLKAIRGDLRKSLGIAISISDLTEMLRKISVSGVIGVAIEDGKVKVTAPKQETPKKIEVMYSYEVRPGLGAPIIDKTRAFCRKLVQSNRLYTREDIQTMTGIFGYDIFKFGGGFYHNPETNETTSHCRHMFKARTVSRKRK